MHRIFLPNQNFKEAIVNVSDVAEAHHVTHVLRLLIGDGVELFNGEGLLAQGKIKNIDPLSIDVENVQQINPQHNTKIILACAIPKNAKFDDIVDKCTQLGVDEIIPMQTQRTEVILKNERAQKRLDRFNAVALSAVKQSKRSFIPHIHPITKFTDVFNLLPKDALMLIPNLEGERQLIKDILVSAKNPASIVIFIGPEGDFTPEEIELALEKGATSVSLGENVLRVDTAAIACVNTIQMLV